MSSGLIQILENCNKRLKEKFKFVKFGPQNM